MSQVIKRRKSLTEQAGILFLGNSLALFLSLIVPIVLVRVFTRGEYGLYRQLILIFVTLLPVGQMGVTQGLYYFLPREPEKRDALITQTAVFVFLIGLLTFILLMLFRDSIARVMNSPEIVNYIPILSSFIFFMIASSFLEALLVAEGKAHLSSLVKVLSGLFRSSIVICTALITRSILAVLVGLLIFSLGRCLFQVYYVYKWYNLSIKRIDIPFWKRQLKYSLPIGLGNVAWLFQTKLHNFFVSAFFSPLTFAIYSVGTYNLPFIGLITTSVSNVVTPELALCQKKGEKRRILEIWSNALRKMNLFFLPTFFFFFVMSYEFIIFLFGKKYVDSVPIFRISLCILVIAGINAGAILNAYAETVYQLKVALFRLPIAIVILYFFTKKWGMMGAVSGDILVTAGFRFIVLGKVAKVMELPLIRLLQPIENGKIILASILASVPVFVTKHFLKLPLILSLAICTLEFILSYLFFATLFQISTRSEVESFFRIILPGSWIKKVLSL